MSEIDEPLGYLSRAEMQLKFMQNIEREIANLHHNNAMRFWWDRSSNWVRVQRFMNGNTMKAGSTSSGQQCFFMGVDPDGKSFY